MTVPQHIKLWDAITRWKNAADTKVRLAAANEVDRVVGEIERAAREGGPACS